MKWGEVAAIVAQVAALGVMAHIATKGIRVDARHAVRIQLHDDDRELLAMGIVELRAARQNGVPVLVCHESKLKALLKKFTGGLDNAGKGATISPPLADHNEEKQ